MTDKLTIEEQEERRLAQIENEAQHHDAKAFRDCEFMGIKDEYFDEPSCDYCECVCMGDPRCIECSGRCTCEVK